MFRSVAEWPSDHVFTSLYARRHTTRELDVALGNRALRGQPSDYNHLWVAMFSRIICRLLANGKTDGEKRKTVPSVMRSVSQYGSLGR